MPRLILASTSPRRKEIMAKSGLVFEVVASGFEEDMTLDLPPAELARRMSAGKAEDVARANPDAVVVAADTIVVLDDMPLGKPGTAERSRDMLSSLSGRTHSVITGLTVRCDAAGRCSTETVETLVKFRNLAPEEIERYIESGEPLDKAGAYGIQGLGGSLVESIEGDYWNVVGLPRDALLSRLKEFGVA
jgi:septum formation protein